MSARDQRMNYPEKLDLGGQAVIEGVLMRSREGYAVALRRAGGRIVVRQVPWRGLTRRLPALKLPVVRGVVSLGEMMALGTRALHWSAEEFDAGLRRQADKGDNPDADPETRPGVGRWHLAGLLVLSLAVAALLVVVAPSLLAHLTGWLPPFQWYATWRGTLGFTEENHPIAYNILSGCFRAALLLGYIWLIARNSDVRRVFQYHGAEHKAVRAYEEGVEITVARAQAHDTLHPRCGTTFLAVVVLLSVLAFAATSASLVAFVGGYPDWALWQRKGMAFAAHLAVLPLVAGLSFELMKLCARHSRRAVCRWILWPGYRLQRLTTRRPDDYQVEVAIVAMLAALAIRPTDTQPQEYVVRGLHDDPSAPGYVPPEGQESPQRVAG